MTVPKGLSPQEREEALARIRAEADSMDPELFAAALAAAALLDRGGQFHLPGRHDQSNHGRRTGRKGFEPFTPREKVKRKALRDVKVDPDADATAPARQGRRSMADWEAEAKRLTALARKTEAERPEVKVAKVPKAPAEKVKRTAGPAKPENYPGPVKGRDLAVDLYDLFEQEDGPLFPAGPVPPYDVGIQHVGRMQGFDAPATRVTKAEMDDLVKNGALEIHRGVHEPWSGEDVSTDDILATVNDGKYEPGQGVYGNGWYFSVNETVAQIYGGDTGRGMRAALKPDARLIEYDEALKQMNKERTEATQEDGIHPEFLHGWGRDVGRWAVTKGYDGVSINGPESDCAKKQGNAAAGPSVTGRRLRGGNPGACHGDGTEFRGRTTTTGYAQQIVVLNRSAIFVQDGHYDTTG